MAHTHFFKAGDRVITPTGRTGTVQRPPWEMPHHVLVKLDTGETYWLLTEILQPAPEPESKPIGNKRSLRTQHCKHSVKKSSISHEQPSELESADRTP